MPNVWYVNLLAYLRYCIRSVFRTIVYHSHKRIKSV